MILLEESILETKKIISSLDHGYGYQNTFSKYSKIYASTNENIDGYLSKLNMEDKNSVLTVMSSGDHPFNVACYGVKDIDTFDINMLTKYFVLGLKRSAILTFNYKQYIRYMNKLFYTKNIDEMSELIKLIMPSMDSEYRIYWKEIIDYNYQLQKKYKTHLNLFQLLSLDKEFTTDNLYLLNEDNYNSLRNLLIKINITFTCCDCHELPNMFKKKYNLIILSNVLDYFFKNKKYRFGWKYKKLAEFEKSINPLLTNNGEIVLNYVFDYHKGQNEIIQYSTISERDLRGEEIITFPSIREKSISKSAMSAIILYKK